MAKQFFYVSMGILALVVAFHLGATNKVSAQPDDKTIVAGGGTGAPANMYDWIVTSSGDLYIGNANSKKSFPWKLTGNIFTGPAEDE